MKSYPLQFLLAHGQHQSDQDLLFPLIKPEVVHLGDDVGAVTNTMVQMAIKQVLTKGRYTELLEWRQPEELEHGTLAVQVAEHQDYILS